MPPMLAVYAQRKMLALLLLGFSSGLPAGLVVGGTLTAWLTDAAIDITTIGLFSLIALPYAAKPLWAPLIDRFALPFAGRRRGWLFATQVALIFAIWWLSGHDPTVDLTSFIIAAIVVAFVSATHDIVVDAYRSDILAEHEAGAGVAGYVLGFRCAGILAGWAALALADTCSWPIVYQLMAGCIGIGLIGTLLAPEPPPLTDPPRGFNQVIIQPFENFVSRRGMRGTRAVLAFVVLYKLGDQILVNVTAPFLIRELEFPKAIVGAVQSGVGLVATIVGVILGGALVARLGINRCLWIFGVLQGGSNVGYWLLARVGADHAWLVGTIATENFCGGLATAAFIGFLLRQCDPRFSATQFALLSGMMVLGRTLLAAPAGALGAHIGWAGFFLFSAAAALPGLALLPLFAPWREVQAPSHSASSRTPT